MVYATVYNLVESNYAPVWRGGNPDYQVSITAFFTNPEVLKRYLAPQLSGMEHVSEVGRLDRLIAPFIELDEEPLKLTTGIGLGALAIAPIDEFSSDKYRYIMEEGKVGTALSRLLWELGILGTLLVLLAHAFVWRDAFALRHRNDLQSALAIGWLGVVPTILFAMAWKNIMENPGVMGTFAFYSGVIVATRFREAQKSSAHRNRKSRNAEAVGLPPILHIGKSQQLSNNIAK